MSSRWFLLTWMILSPTLGSAQTLEAALDVNELKKECESQSEEHSWINQSEEDFGELTYACLKGDTPDGPYASWYENTQLKKQGRFEGGKLEGRWTRYYENGRIKDRGVWSNGRSTGAWIGHHETGKKSFEGKFSKKGLRTGKWQTFNDDGALETEGFYVNNEKVCAWKEFYSETEFTWIAEKEVSKCPKSFLIAKRQDHRWRAGLDLAYNTYSYNENGSTKLDSSMISLGLDLESRHFRKLIWIKGFFFLDTFALSNTPEEFGGKTLRTGIELTHPISWLSKPWHWRVHLSYWFEDIMKTDSSATESFEPYTNLFAFSTDTTFGYDFSEDTRLRFRLSFGHLFTDTFNLLNFDQTAAEAKISVAFRLLDFYELHPFFAARTVMTSTTSQLNGGTNRDISTGRFSFGIRSVIRF